MQISIFWKGGTVATLGVINVDIGVRFSLSNSGFLGNSL
jgi:hypothetical protein